MDNKVKVLSFYLKDKHLVYIYISYISDKYRINGTCRDTFIISIPQWRWSMETGKATNSKYFWEYNLKETIDESLFEYIPEISKELSKINLKKECKIERKSNK